MDPLTQGALGSVAAQSVSDSRRIRSFAIAGAIAAMAPDLDVFIRSETDPLLYLEFHRQFSHSLIFIPVGAFICTLFLHVFLHKRITFFETFFACLLGYATHGLLDASTSYGTQLLWPFSDNRIALSWISVVDPVFTLPLLVLTLVAWWRRRAWFAVAGLSWALLYLMLGAWQHHRALEAASTLAMSRGHEVDRIMVKPGFANILLWKSIYETNGRYYVDGIRTGLEVLICEGEFINALNRSQDLPWLDPDGQQRADLERFFTLSDGWLAIDREDPNYVVDVRYAALPHRIEALWGLKLDPDAQASVHADWHVEKRRRSTDLESIFPLLTGHGCRGLESR